MMRRVFIGLLGVSLVIGSGFTAIETHGAPSGILEHYWGGLTIIGMIVGVTLALIAIVPPDWFP